MSTVSVHGPALSMATAAEYDVGEADSTSQPLYVRDVEGIYARHVSQLHAAYKFFYGEADGIKMYKPYTYAIHGEADGTSLCI